MAHSSQVGEYETDDVAVWSSIDNRLNSFQHFPHSQNISPQRLARAGFYFTGKGDMVRCFSCHATIQDWNRGDTPLERHHQASPHCMFLNCAHGLRDPNFVCNNDYDEEAENRKFLLRTGGVVDDSFYPVVPEMRSEEARLNTFTNWPADVPVQPGDLAEAGMFYIGTEDRVRCFCCGGSLEGWQQGDDAWGEHSRFYGDCFFILGHNVGNEPLTAPRAGVNRRCPSMETFESRLESFRGRQHPIDPERLARAGFYSNGEQDRVTCFRCGGGVKEWMPEEDPWEEHARHYPGCSFVRAEKGEEYISSVQLRYPKGDHSRSSQNGFHHEDGAHKVLQSEVAQKAVEMGFDPMEVERTILEKLRQNKEGYTTVEALIQDLSEQEGASENHADPMTKLEELQREKLCKVCMDSDISIVFIPCGHLVTCQKCSEALLKCPICCATISQKIKTYNA